MFGYGDLSIGFAVRSGSIRHRPTIPAFSVPYKAQATLAQSRGSPQQTQASRELAEVTSARDSGWSSRDG
ncbi:hypothetical protein ACVWYH_005687 [Bradyrhizobium sp. GM24.11]